MYKVSGQLLHTCGTTPGTQPGPSGVCTASGDHAAKALPSQAHVDSAAAIAGDGAALPGDGGALPCDGGALPGDDHAIEHGANGTAVGTGEGANAQQPKWIWVVAPSGRLYVAPKVSDLRSLSWPLLSMSWGAVYSIMQVRH